MICCDVLCQLVWCGAVWYHSACCASCINMVSCLALLLPSDSMRRNLHIQDGSSVGTPRGLAPSQAASLKPIMDSVAGHARGAAALLATCVGCFPGRHFDAAAWVPAASRHKLRKPAAGSLDPPPVSSMCPLMHAASRVHILRSVSAAGCPWAFPPGSSCRPWTWPAA